MSNEEQNNVEELVIKWKIENFLMLQQPNGECIISSPIVEKSVSNTSWYLTLYPRGIDKPSFEYISCYLWSVGTVNLESFELHSKLSVNSVEMEEKTHYGKEMRVKFGKELFLRRDSILNYNEPLNIECYVRMVFNSFGDVDNHASNDVNNHAVCIPFTAQSDKISAKNKLQFSHINEEKLHSFSPSVNQCFIHSQILREKFAFTYPIKDLEFDDENHIFFPYIAVNNFICLVYLQISGDDVDLRVKFLVENKELTNLEKSFLFCAIHILNSDREIFNLIKDEYLVKDEPYFWHFCHPFKWNDVKANKNSQFICFEISLLDGRILTDMEWFGNVNYNNELSPPDYPISAFPKEVLQFYKENKFCDITVQTKDKIFECHKIVLCAMSPVFTYMFESGMKESHLNVIKINDLDSDIVSQMINFLYTGTVKELEFKNAMNLFSVADLYQIDSLKTVCRDFLKKNLNHENVCEILSFSDARNDKNLKQSAVEYIFTNRNEILLSPQWNELSAKDLQLAYEILMNLIPVKNEKK